MANIERLREVLGHIKNDPKSWEQDSWATRKENDCGTAFCFAGWASQKAGYLAIFSGGYYSGDNLTSRCVQAEEALDFGTIEKGSVTSDVGKDYYLESYGIYQVARDWLDLNEWQADGLFNGENTLVDLEKIINEIESGDYLGYDENDDEEEF